MKQDFPNKMPRHEQLARTAKTKQVGRKHNHTKGPGKAAQAALNHQRGVAQFKSGRAKLFKDAISAYWRGELDTYPMPPRGYE